MKLSYNINDVGNRHEKYERGVQKPRGLENAAIQRDKHNKQETKISQPLGKKDDVEKLIESAYKKSSPKYLQLPSVIFNDTNLIVPINISNESFTVQV